MQDVFTVVGLVSVPMFSVGVLLFFASWVMQVRNESYYRGLRAQLVEAAVAIAKTYRDGEAISAGSVRQLLWALHDRRFTVIAHMKENDLIRLDLRAICGTHLEKLLDLYGSPLTEEQREIIRTEILGVE